MKAVQDEMLLLLSGSCVEGKKGNLEGLPRKEYDELLVGKEEEDKTSDV